MQEKDGCEFGKQQPSTADCETGILAQVMHADEKRNKVKRIRPPDLCGVTEVR